MTDHFVQFYEDDTFLITQVAAFIRAGLRAGDAVIVIATKQHREDLEKCLSEHLSPPAMQPPGADQYIVLDAADTFSKFMVGGQPNMQTLADMVGPILKRAAGDGIRRVRVVGEMVGLLAANGDHESAIRLEEFWNNLAKASPFSMSLFCAYPMQAFPLDADGVPFRSICNAHSRVGPTESYTPPADAHEHFTAIAACQQKAYALKTEIAHRTYIEALPRRE